MATYDISRVAFNPRKRYSSVRMQQGRVLTDDDWNENQRIEEELLRRTQVDIIGRSGSPDNGFKISGLSAGSLIDFDIHKGTLYTGGIRFEMDKTEKFSLQKDWLQKKNSDFTVPKPADFPPGKTELFDLVYFEGWQQAVCAVEDSSLFEVALGGPDTTVMLRRQARVKLFRNTDSDECPISWKKLRTDWKNNKLGTINKEGELIPDTNLKVSFTDAGGTDDLCAPSVAGGYLGAENQALRVQVISYDQSSQSGRLTWGFDNAAPLYRVIVAADGVTVTMRTEPKDQYHWPLAGQVVEILAWSSVLPNNEKIAEQSGFLSKVAISYNPDNQSFKINTPLPAGFGNEWQNRTDKDDLSMKENFFFIRVWNRGSDITSEPGIKFTPGAPVSLGNTGLEVTLTGGDFIPPDGTTGNFWVIAARPSTPKLLSPWEFTTTGISPHGVRFFYSPLAIIKWTLTSTSTVEGLIIRDCRKRFNPLTEQECCCTFSVGDGVTSKGDFQSMQEAIDSLPGDGGKICVLPGIHEANIKITGRQKIYIAGCGEQSIIRPPAAGNDTTIILVQNSQKVKIENLTLVTFNGIAINIDDVQGEGSASSAINIRENRILACIHGVRVYVRGDVATENNEYKNFGNNIKISHNLIGMYDKDEGDTAIFSIADDVLIERNRLTIIVPPSIDPDDPRPDPPGGDPFDPCKTDKKLYERNRRFRDIITASLHYVSTYIPTATPKIFKALGGIQIGCGSEKVWIWQNEIFGGRGNGVTLGHFEPILLREGKVTYPTLYDITIQENLIYEMGLSGIGTVLFLVLNNQANIIYTDQLSILGNTIRYCVHQLERSEPIRLEDTEIPYAAVCLAFCEDCIIRENLIEENGLTQQKLISGIYVFFADKIDISENHVIDNGPDLQDQRFDASPKGGIIIWFATRIPQPKYTTAEILLRSDRSVSNTARVYSSLSLPDAVPAAKIHDNIVSQPVGHALFIIAFGPVSVANNQFNSQGINEAELFSLLAGTVFILNVGVSKDLLAIILMHLKNWGYNSPAASKTRTPYENKIQNLPSGKILFSDNQVTLDLRSRELEFCLCSQLMFSLDDIGFIGNQSECCGFVDPLNTSDIRDVAIFNTFLFSISVRCNDNRFTDGLIAAKTEAQKNSLLSLALMNTAIGNQSTRCLAVPFFAYRRKALNIHINAEECILPLLEDRLNNKNNHNFTNPAFNVATF